MNPRGVQLTKIALGLGVLGLFAGIVLAEEPVTGLEDWEFLLGDWQIVAKRYSFESELIEQTDGQATFSHTMNGRRIQELQSTIHAGQRSEALVILVYSPRAEQIEIVRTDSGHFSFSIWVGKMSKEKLEFRQKHPNPDSEVTRRLSYLRKDDQHFIRRLEFSPDQGETWFVRSEMVYRKPLSKSSSRMKGRSAEGAG